MTQILSTRQWRSRGVSDLDLRSRVDKGELVRVRRGSYAHAEDGRSAEETHRLMVIATVPELHEKSVVSHASAAVLHGLPVPNASLGKVQTTRPDRRTGKTSTRTRRMSGHVDEMDVTTISGIRVTTLARTLVDLGRSQPLGWAVAAFDQALREGRVTRDEVRSALDRLGAVRGTRQGRRMLELGVDTSESVGESLSRVVFIDAGLPEPARQVDFQDERGPIGRVDFYWRGSWVIGEFDGMGKYDELARPGESPRDVLRREKRREDRLRALGHLVVRWTWDEIFHQPDLVVQRVRAALDAAARAHRTVAVQVPAS